ncbi:protein C3orf33 homolog [Brienomyrus brachyistius]|uniref:protein C3orf33 homolog n=1 Tax=Brienomyrus brachyistius TaxID=42636 RepID=UPI0020B21D97|nr:protein C3orf33 homolog [Brienomyrus brachyistius]
MTSNMAEPPPVVPPRTGSVGTGKASSNVVSTISQFADDHLTLVRSLSTGLAIAGVVIIARSIKLTAKFGAASEIPAFFVERNVSLRGRVHRVTDKGLEVEHTPIRIPVLSSLLGKCRSDSLLDVRLAGVQVTDEGWAWLRDHLTSTETVWFRLIRRDNDTLDCLVSLGRRVAFNMCVNEELLRLGLGRTVPVLGLHHGSRFYWRVHRRLLRAEVQAERKRRGLWVQESFWKRLAGALSGSAVVRLLIKLFKRT